MALAAVSWGGRVLASEAPGRQVVPGLKWTAARRLPRVRSCCLAPPPPLPLLQPLRLRLPESAQHLWGGWVRGCRNRRGERELACGEGCCLSGSRRCHHQHRTSSGCQRERRGEEERRRRCRWWTPRWVSAGGGGGERRRRGAGRGGRGLGVGETLLAVWDLELPALGALRQRLGREETWSELCPLKC